MTPPPPAASTVTDSHPVRLTDDEQGFGDRAPAADYVGARARRPAGVIASVSHTHAITGTDTDTDTSTRAGRPHPGAGLADAPYFDVTEPSGVASPPAV